MIFAVKQISLYGRTIKKDISAFIHLQQAELVVLRLAPNTHLDINETANEFYQSV